MPLPDRQYFSLCSLAGRWGVENDDIKYYVEHGELHTCCWLDLREVMRYQPRKERCSITCEYIEYEGYVGLCPRDCRKIFRCGKYKLTSFIDLERDGFEIAITPQSRDAIISLDDIVVSKKECKRFERLHGICPKKPAKPCRAEMLGKIDLTLNGSHAVKCAGLYINQRRQEYYFRGELLRLGPIQSNIIEQLVEARRTEAPWVHGKTLLHRAGSQAVRMRDVFKSQSMWREVVQSDKRGHYRISSDVEIEMA